MADQSYDHPTFLVTQQNMLKSQQGPAASLTDFAVFRCRNKCVVTHVTVACVSMTTTGVTTWSLQVMRTGATGTSTHTIATKTISSFSGVGLLGTITLASSNTLTTAGAYFSLEQDSLEKGKFDVIWEYRLIP